MVRGERDKGRMVRREAKVAATHLVPPPWEPVLPPTVSVRAMGDGDVVWVVWPGVDRRGRGVRRLHVPQARVWVWGSRPWGHARRGRDVWPVEEGDAFDPCQHAGRWGRTPRPRPRPPP